MMDQLLFILVLTKNLKGCGNGLKCFDPLHSTGSSCFHVKNENIIDFFLNDTSRKIIHMNFS